MNYFCLLANILQSRLIKNKPTITSWFITNKCQSKCLYCDYWKSPQNDNLCYADIVNTIDTLHKMGTRLMHFSGGEPLMREDIIHILAHTYKKGIHISLNSNGLLVPEKINEFKNYVKVLKLSLDGPPEINNYLRGINSFDKVITSIELAKKFKIKTIISSLITTHNYEYIDYLIDLANKYSTKVLFMFAYNKKLKSETANPYAINKKLREKIVTKIIKKIKSNQGKGISNSITGLSYLINPQNIKCQLQKINLVIDENGYIDTGCGTKAISREFNIKKDSLEKAYDYLITTKPCLKECWCAPKIEINSLLSGNPKIIVDSIKNLFF